MPRVDEVARELNLTRPDRPLDADVRIVEASGRQVPYLVERRDEPLSIDLAIRDDTPAEAVFQFPGGLSDHLREQIGETEEERNLFSILRHGDDLHDWVGYAALAAVMLRILWGFVAPAHAKTPNSGAYFTRPAPTGNLPAASSST